MSDFTPDPDFDERARAAGRELRQPPPPDGLRNLRRARRNRRLAQAGGTLAVVAIGVGGIVAVTRGDDNSTITTADSTIVTTPVSAPVTVPGTTAPAVVPSSPPTSASTSEPGGASPTTIPGDAPGPPTVWVGEKLAGYFSDGRFVAATRSDELPPELRGIDIQLRNAAGRTINATAATRDCYTAYLDPSPDTWDVWATTDAPLLDPPSDTGGDGLAEMNADLVELGVDPVHTRSYGAAFAADGSIDRLVLFDGWSADGFESPTWIATWSAATREFTTIEPRVDESVEDPLDPSNSIAMGTPLERWLDLDADGNWEIVFAYGDAWGARELATNDWVVVGDAHSCPDGLDAPTPTVPSAVLDLAGEWALTPGQAPAVIIRADGTGRSGTCELVAVQIDDWVGLPGSGPACVPVGASPEVEDLILDLGGGAQLRLDTEADQLVVSFDGERRLVRVS